MPKPPLITPAAIRALSLFVHYTGLSPKECAVELTQLLHEEPDVHAALLVMLAARSESHSLDQPFISAGHHPSVASKTAEPDSRIGSRLGVWRIDRKISEGGMGAVYEAHRDDGQYQQRVALKCIRVELASETLVTTFLQERNHLARLEHPHIAALLDGGVDTEGHPWFAMRYVDGIPIDRWCDERQLTVTQRVRLLLQACDALAYAHAQGVLHQDIKPSNLLVTTDGQVQLLDFGLSSPLGLASAKIVQPLALSPGYTAPEIAFTSETPTVAADIYSLGAVLCRLLCGTVPSPSLLVQMGQYADPDNRDPGIRLSDLALQAHPDVLAARSVTTPAALARQLQGDLEAVVSRCTALAADRRYRNVDQLHDDLRRWLTHRPTQARPLNVPQRSGLFLRRHWLASTFAGLALVTMLVGGGAATWQMHQARQEAEATLAVTDLFEETLGTATLSGLSASPFSSAALLQTTERKIRKLPLQEQPQVFARAMTTLARSYATIGDYGHAAQLATEAANLQKGDAISAMDAQATLASLLNIQARPADARRVGRAALAKLKDDKKAIPVRLRLLTEVARSEWNLTRHPEAKRVLDSALALAEGQRTDDPTAVIELLTLRGQWNSRLTRLSLAEADLRQAIALATPKHPLLADNARLSLARALQWEERAGEARQIASQLLANRRRVLGEHHPDTGSAWLILGWNQCVTGQRDACRTSIDRGKTILRSTYGESHPLYADALLMSVAVTGDYQHKKQQALYETRLAEMRLAASILHKAYGPVHENTIGSDAHVGMMLMHPKNMSLYNAELANQRWEEGLALLKSASDAADRHKVTLVVPKLYLARALATRNGPGDVEQAEQILRKAQADIEQHLAPSHSYHFRVRYSLAAVRYFAGDLPGADSRLVALLPQVTAALPQENAPFILCNIWLLRAHIAIRQGQPKKAKAFLIQMRDTANRWIGPESYPAKNAKTQLDALQRTGKFPSP